MNEKMKQVMKVHSDLELIRNKVEKAIMNVEGCSQVPPKVYDYAVHLMHIANRLVNYLEDNDANMEVGAIGPVDGLFENNPVTDYVNANVDFLQGTISMEEATKRMKEAAEKIAEQQQPKQKVGTVEEFVEHIINDLPFCESEQAYKEQFKVALLSAVKQLQQREGLSRFGVTINGKGEDGGISSTRGSVTIEVCGKEYTFPEVTPEEAAGCSGDPETCELDNFCCSACCNCGAFPESSTMFPVPAPDCPEGCEECSLEGVELVDYVREFDEDVVLGTLEIMNVIEQELENKTQFTPEDIELIRFYLRNLPNNSAYDIEELSDRAAVLAWLQRKARK